MESKLQTFATCLSCMDGRVTLPVTKFIREMHNVEFVDYITEAGMDGFISHFGPLDGILRKIDISFQKHGSAIAYVVGHADCSGNPVDDDQHRKDILSAIERLKTFRSLAAIGGLFVSRDWRVFPVTSVPTIKQQSTTQPATGSPPTSAPLISVPAQKSWAAQSPPVKSGPSESTYAPVSTILTPSPWNVSREKEASAPLTPTSSPKKAIDPMPNSVLKCPSCGAPNEPDSNFCDQCSEPLSKKI